MRFLAITFADGSNSFDRASESATAGWTTARALQGGDSCPLLTELRDAKPAYAIVMYGTNDLNFWGVDVFSTNMGTIIDDCESMGVVAILSTIPDRMDNPSLEPMVMSYNDALRTLAQQRHLPIIDFWSALQSLPNHGVSSDGIHPSIYVGTDGNADAGYFTDEALQFGYNVRNLTAVQMLDHLRRTFP